jgi:hypothetical protein
MGAPSALTVQTVLFHTPPVALLRSVASVGRAVAGARGAGLEGPVVVAHGDASPSPLDGTVIERLEEIAAGAGVQYRYRHFGENTGSARGQNLLAADQPAQWHLMTNPDVILGGTCLHELFAAGTPDVGELEGRQLPLEETKVFDPVTGTTSWATGSCSLVRGEAWTAVGGYDEGTFFLYCDDVDLSWRIRLAGWRVVHVPTARVFHPKRLAEDGRPQVTESEFFYSALASYQMAVKWGTEADRERVEANLSGEPFAAVRQEIDRREAAGRRPAPMFDAGRVAHFNPDGSFGEMRLP